MASLLTGFKQSFTGSRTERTRSSNDRFPSTFPSRMKIPSDSENPASLAIIRAFSKFRGLVKTFLTLETLARCISSYGVGDAGNRANGMPTAKNEWTSAMYSYIQGTSVSAGLGAKPERLTMQFSLMIPTIAFSS